MKLSPLWRSEWTQNRMVEHMHPVPEAGFTLRDNRIHRRHLCPNLVLHLLRRQASWPRHRRGLTAGGRELVRPNLRILDAGAGFGTATFALLEALRSRNIDPEVIDAFDLTPATLAQFRCALDSQNITQVRLKQANVLELDRSYPRPGATTI